jgi:hypothetical protein
MDIIQAIKMAKGGLKMRCKSWIAEDFIYIHPNSNLVLKSTDISDDKIATFYTHEFLSDEWEILEEVK